MTTTSISCKCGTVQGVATGAAIIAVACYCDDCQKGSRQIEALPNAPRVLTPDGGSEYVLWRKDRIRWPKGAKQLQDFRLKLDSPTKRVVAGCCNSAMYLDFQKGHWLSVYRARCAGAVPPTEMHIQTRFRSERAAAGDVPAYRSFAPRFIGRLLLARLSMLLRL